jgi:tetrahydromethanopterin S-methyltransferase subunit G
MENEIEELNDRIARLEETNAEYRQRYGTGTRPAWVGEEIGINMMYIDIAKRQIAALKGEGQ